MTEESQNKVVGSGSMPFDKEYAQWIAELAKRYRSSQIKASIKVNDEMLRFYWSVGEDIEKRQFENRYGGRFYENVSKDLKHALGLSEGLSPTTIKYTRYFYQLYSPLFANRQQGVDESVSENRQGVIDDFESIFMVPWSLHILIIDKLKNDPKNAIWQFCRYVFVPQWGRMGRHSVPQN